MSNPTEFQRQVKELVESKRGYEGLDTDLLRVVTALFIRGHVSYEWRRDLGSEHMSATAINYLSLIYSHSIKEDRAAIAVRMAEEWIDGMVIELAEPIKQHFYEAGLDVAEDDKERQRDLVQGI
jgi:hypothetical protein